MSELVVRPHRIRIEATSVCQLKCPQCPTASGETQPVLKTGHLRLNHFKRLLDENPGLIHVELSNYGELFLNPELTKLMAYAFERGVTLTADNGSNLNTVKEPVLEALVKYRFSRITCSIDGASQETYKQYRVGGNFEIVIENIRTINRYKAQYGSKLPLLKWQFVVFPHNRHEIEAARQLAKQLNMGFYEKLSWTEVPTDLVQIGSAGGVATRAEHLEKYGVNYMRPICHQLWRIPQVNWDGRMLGCCRNYWGEFGGNVFEDGLHKVVNSEAMLHARAMLLGKREERNDLPCTTCELYLDMKKNGNWLTLDEVYVPQLVLDLLSRHGLRNRFTIGASALIVRAGEAVLLAVSKLLRRKRVQG
jgi:hypothetical protein